MKSKKNKRKLIQPILSDLQIGNIVIEPGNAEVYKTGDWRSDRPVHNEENCIKCGICYIFCPEGCIHFKENGYPEVNLFYCKGCGICAKECISGAIVMIEEPE